MQQRDRSLSLRISPDLPGSGGMEFAGGNKRWKREKTDHVMGGRTGNENREVRIETDDITHKKSASFYGKHFFYA